MRDVWTDFREIFRPAPRREAEADDNAMAEEIERLRSWAGDVRAWVSSPIYGDVRKALDAQMRSIRPDPRLGVEAAGAAALQRDGLQMACDMLDAMVRRAEEALNG